MPEICLPQKIIYGADALKKIPKNDYSHILIVSDGGIVESIKILKICIIPPKSICLYLM